MHLDKTKHGFTRNGTSPNKFLKVILFTKLCKNWYVLRFNLKEGVFKKTNNAYCISEVFILSLHECEFIPTSQNFTMKLPFIFVFPYFMLIQNTILEFYDK